jgi:DNA polymerase I-like protein with 3'-5' exonuclease and polymerase domains
MRQQAKAANFGFLFGMGAEKFVTYAADSYDVDFTDDEAERFRKGFFDTWVGMDTWHNRQRKLAREYGCVKSPLGRIRHLPDIYSKTEFYRSRAERQAINSPVQGMASDMMLIAASKIRKHFPLIRPVALVHDCILCEVPEARAHEFALNIKTTMENVGQDLKRLGCNFSVPLVADVAIGKSWGDCEELAA